MDFPKRINDKRRNKLGWVYATALVASGGSGGCFVFNSDRESKIVEDDDFKTPEDTGNTIDAGGDTGDTTGDTAGDTGDTDQVIDMGTNPESRIWDNTCSEVNEAISSSPTVLHPFSLVGMTNSMQDLSACGEFGLWGGPDGFFAIDAKEGDRWYVMAGPVGSGAIEDDLAIFTLSTCKEADCIEAADLCRVGEPEHINFVADHDGFHYIGIDSITSGGVSVMAVQLSCGDGVSEPGETCDDGNQEDGDGCSIDCRVELDEGHNAEVEPNDQRYEANIVHFPENGDTGTLTLEATVGGGCDVDSFMVSVPEGASIRAIVRDKDGAPCDLDGPQLLMQFFSNDGSTLIEVIESADGCPEMQDQNFAKNLIAGNYQVSVELPVYSCDEVTIGSFDYQIEIEVLAP